MGSLTDRLGRDVKGWQPEPGDVITGVILGFGTQPSDWGEGSYPTIEIATPDLDHDVMVHAFHTVLKNELANQKPEIGDEIGIKYKGKETAKRVDAKGKPIEFESYRVVVEKRQATVETPDWDSMKDNDESPVPSATDDEEPF